MSDVSPALPPAAIRAATKAVRQATLAVPCPEDREIAEAVLAAAMPHLAVSPVQAAGSTQDGRELVPAEAIEAAALTLSWCFDQPGPHPDLNVARAVLTAAAPLIAAAERERLFRTPAVQRFVIEDCLLCCAGCGESIAEDRIEHQAGCSEMRLADLLAAADGRDTADGGEQHD